MQIEQVSEYIGQILALDSFSLEKSKLNTSLPLVLKKGYDFYALTLYGTEAICIVPKSEIKATQLLKQSRTISAKLQKVVVVALNGVTTYMRKLLIQERINFVVPHKQLHLPDFLTSFTEQFSPPREEVEILSMPAQLLVLFHIQKESLNNRTLRDVAKEFNYAPMTITRAVRELEKLELCTPENAGTSKLIQFTLEGKALWEKAKPHLSSPVTKTLTIKEYTNLFTQYNEGHVRPLKAGEYALAAQTNLSPGEEVYALPKEYVQESKKSKDFKLTEEYEPGIALEVWGYNPYFLTQDNGAVDPLSLILSLREEEDERIEMELQKLEEQITW